MSALIRSKLFAKALSRQKKIPTSKQKVERVENVVLRSKTVMFLTGKLFVKSDKNNA